MRTRFIPLLLIVLISLNLFSQKHTNLNFTGPVLSPSAVGIQLDNCSGFYLAKDKSDPSHKRFKVSSTLFGTSNGITEAYPRITTYNNDAIVDDYYYNATSFSSTKHHALGVEYDQVTNSFISIGTLDEGNTAKGFFITKEDNTTGSIVWSKEISFIDPFQNPILGDYSPNSISILKNIDPTTSLYAALPNNQKVAYAVTGQIRLTTAASIGFVVIISPSGAVLSQKLVTDHTYVTNTTNPLYCHPKKVIEIDNEGIYITGTIGSTDEYKCGNTTTIGFSQYVLSIKFDYDLNVIWNKNFVSSFVLGGECPDLVLPSRDDGGVACHYDAIQHIIYLNVFSVHPLKQDAVNVFVKIYDFNNSAVNIRPGDIEGQFYYGFRDPLLPNQFGSPAFVINQIEQDPFNISQLILSGYAKRNIVLPNGLNSEELDYTRIKYDKILNKFLPVSAADLVTISNHSYSGNDISNDYSAFPNITGTNELHSNFIPNISNIDAYSNIGIISKREGNSNNYFNLKVLNFNNSSCQPIKAEILMKTPTYFKYFHPADVFVIESVSSNIVWNKISLNGIGNSYNECNPGSPLNLSVTIVQPTCGVAGSIQSTVTGGNGPFVFNLKRNGKNGTNGHQLILSNANGSFTNLGPGGYTIILTDANGISTQQTFTINSPVYSTTNLASNDNLANARALLVANATPSPIESKTNWNDPNRAVNHQLYSSGDNALKNSTIETNLGELQPFANDFGQNLVHSVWFKFYVPNIPSKVRLFTNLGQLANARTAIAVYEKTSPHTVCNATYSDLSLVCQSYDHKPYFDPNLPPRINYYPVLPMPKYFNNTSNLPVLGPVVCDVVETPSSIRNIPERSFIEFKATGDKVYYVQVFMINPNYNQNSFIDANINQNNECKVDDKLYLSIDLEPISFIHDNPINAWNYEIEILRAGPNQSIDPTEYRFYTKYFPNDALNICNSSIAYNLYTLPPPPYSFTGNTAKINLTFVPFSFPPYNYWAAYRFNNTGKCWFGDNWLTTKVHNVGAPAPSGQSLKTDGTSSIESISPESKGIRISPNPATVELNISFDDQSLKVSSLEIINVNGQVISNIKVDENASDLKLNVSEYVNGSYIMHFRDEERNVLKSYKFIKE